MARTRENKTKAISSALKKDFSQILKDMYIIEQLSAQEISEKLLKLTHISITTRSIQRVLKTLGLTRSYSDAFNLCIKKGRKSYEHLKRPIKARELRKGINLRLRYEIMRRDSFKCVLCGRAAKDDRLVIDHIVPVVKGGTNEPTNLRILCFTCNHGKMLSEERK